MKYSSSPCTSHETKELFDYIIDYFKNWRTNHISTDPEGNAKSFQKLSYLELHSPHMIP